MEEGIPKKREVAESEASGVMRWLLTYADMITLLFALYVVLFVLGQGEKERMTEMMKEVYGFEDKEIENISPFGGLRGLMERMGAAFRSKEESPKETIRRLSRVAEVAKKTSALEKTAIQLEEYIKEKGLEKYVMLERGERGLHIRLMTDEVLFTIGKSDLRDEARKILDEVALIIKKNKVKNPIRIEGHTCNLPINTLEFPDNMALSQGRAYAVWKYLILKHGFDPKKVSPLGRGEYYPLYPNIDERNRSKNRRIEIIILLGEEKEGR